MSNVITDSRTAAQCGFPPIKQKQTVNIVVSGSRLGVTELRTRRIIILEFPSVSTPKGEATPIKSVDSVFTTTSFSMPVLQTSLPTCFFRSRSTTELCFSAQFPRITLQSTVSATVGQRTSGKTLFTVSLPVVNGTKTVTNSGTIVV